MKTTAIAFVLLVSSFALVGLTPQAAAFDYCVEGTWKDCDRHLVCIGRSKDYYGERCSYGIPWHCCPWLA